MRKRKFKGRSTKRVIEKCVGTCITYDVIGFAYADRLATDEEITEFSVNVPMETEDDYMSDFVCKKTDGSLRVRECDT